jgi:hypothetical protein
VCELVPEFVGIRGGGGGGGGLLTWVSNVSVGIPLARPFTLVLTLWRSLSLTGACVGALFLSIRLMRLWGWSLALFSPFEFEQ